MPEFVKADAERLAEAGGGAEAHDVRVACRPGTWRPVPRLPRRRSAATRGNILATFFKKQGDYRNQRNHGEWPETVGNTRRAAISRGSQPVELGGFEPPTPSMPWRCATSCAIAPVGLQLSCPFFADLVYITTPLADIKIDHHSRRVALDSTTAHPRQEYRLKSCWWLRYRASGTAVQGRQ